MSSRSQTSDLPVQEHAGGGAPSKAKINAEARLLAKISDRIQAGAGTGHRAEYTPWLPVTRRNSSPHSNQIVAWLPPLGRSAHFFSRGEYRTALLLLWLGVVDLREQFPIWPMPHPHPLDGAIGAPSNLPWSQGLLDIASAAGIDHGYEVGSRIPYVATIDLLATVRSAGRLNVVAFSSKPISNSSAFLGWRTHERLELERRYANALPCPYFVTSSSLVPATMAANLESWMADAILDRPDNLLHKVELFSSQISLHGNLAARDAIGRAGVACGISHDDAWRLYRHCAWHQIIDVDPTCRFLTSYPLPQGGQVIQRELADKLLYAR
jgi:hypothetical protein